MHRVNDDLQSLIPRHKLDTERAEQLVARGFPAVAPVLRDILCWIVTPNDMVALVFGPFVRDLEADAVPAIVEHLGDAFGEGKYGVLSLVVHQMAHATVQKLVPALERLALEPSD